MTTGTVYLVGAGPGDPGLLTLRARDLIEQCDTLVYDHLVNARILGWAKSGCEKIYVGKEPARHLMPQEEITAVLVQHARQGKCVVRLKGGDPFVFGRGGEEASALAAAHIPFEIVPGVTAALAAAAYAGVPLTHRDLSSSVCLVTGHEDPEKTGSRVDFRTYGKTAGTLCIYMGMAQLDRIAAELIEGGMPPTRPAAVIQWATLPRQQSVTGTLGEIARLAREADLASPAIILIGDVVALGNDLAWFEGRPLFGRRIAVTRTREQVGEMRRKLEDLGAEVLELPLIQVDYKVGVEATVDVFLELATYNWIVFTSPNGVRGFFQVFFKRFKDLRCLGPMRIACLGAATAAELTKLHLEVDVLPEKAVSEELGKAILAFESLDNLNILVVTGNRNRDALAKMLETEGGAIVDTYAVYETHETDLAEHPAARDFRERGADAVTFTSSSTVKSYVAQAKGLTLAEGAKVPLSACIGPITAQTLREAGRTVDIEAPEHSVDGLIRALVERFTRS